MARMTLLQTYQALKEAGTSDDFPKLLGNVAHKKLLKAYNAKNSRWREWTAQGDLVDFKTHDRVILSEAPDLLPIDGEGQPYEDSGMPVDDRYQIKLGTKGRMFGLTRQAIINDDLNGFLRMPDAYGRGAQRTLAKDAVKVLEVNPTCFDGSALFASGHANTVAGNLTADDAGVVKLGSAWTKMANATDPRSGEKIGVTPWALLCAPTMAIVCQRLLGLGELRPVSTSGGPVNNPFAPGGSMALPGGVIVEPFLTFTDRVYLIANPADMPVVEVGFLNGVQEPTLLFQKPQAQRVVGGGDDPYSFDVDDMWWKVRHDWATAVAQYQGVVGIGGGLT